MSVSKVKKQFEELSAYLGRDVSGVEKLRKLKESFNDIRTQLAASKEANCVSEARTQTLFTESNKAKTELAEARNEIHRLGQLLENVSRDLSEAVKPDPEDEEDAVASDSACAQGRYLSVIKELRRHVKTCPDPSAPLRDGAIKSTFFFKRESISKGWSHKSLWILGASVAVLSAAWGQVGVTSGECIFDLESVDEGTDKKKHHTIRWLEHLIDFGANDPVRRLSDIASSQERSNASSSKKCVGSLVSSG